MVHTDQDTISEEQARWFLMLPDKIRKQQFSREEQVALTVRCKKVLETVAPALAKDAYRRCLGIGPDDQLSSAAKPRPSTSSGSAVHENKTLLPGKSHSKISSESMNTEMEIFNLYSQHDATDGSNLSTMSPAAATPLASKDVTGTDKPKQQVLGRKRSLKPLALPPPTLAPQVPSVPPRLSSGSARHLVLSARLSRPFLESVNTPTEAKVLKHFHDEEAREQLRTAVASPENFDEALAFGFSATVGPESEPSPSTTDECFPIQQPELYQSEYEDEDSHSVESEGPGTPTIQSETHATVKLPSFDSAVDFPLDENVRDKTPSYGSPSESIGSREMTIHMTLTRRDLRSPLGLNESEQPLMRTAIADKLDPLALESLPVCNDPTGAHGAFAVLDQVSNTGLKRVWRTLRGH